MTKVKFFLSFSIFIVIVSLFSPQAFSWDNALTTAQTKHAEISVFSNYSAFPKNHKIDLAVVMKLQPGWHIYWKNPGDAGEPVNISFVGKDANDISYSEMKWPIPKLIPEGHLVAYGYEKEAAFPFHLYEKSSKANELIKMHAKWLICNRICVPEAVDLEFTIPQGDKISINDGNASKLTELFKIMPGDGPPSTLSSEGIISFNEAITIETLDFFPEKAGVINQTNPVKWGQDKSKITLALHPDMLQKPPFWENDIKGLVVLNADHNPKAYWIDAKVIFNKNISDYQWGTLFYLSFLAFMGGIILNFMPCVFPVLAMKIMGISRLAEHKRRKHIVSTVIYAMGIIGSFILLGFILFLLKHSGQNVGWGFQFQSPIFVMSMCWFLFLMGLSFLGILEIQNERITTLLSRFTLKGHIQDLLTGFLAVLLASPCTAPFMGVAVATALSSSIWMCFLIFCFMGIGMALPYVLFILFPKTIHILPRPGQWMIIFRQFLAFPVFAVCVWLLWVISFQAGPEAIAITAGGLVFLSMGAWSWHIQKIMYHDGSRRFLKAISILLFTACLGSIIVFSQDSSESFLPRKTVLVENNLIEPFSEERLSVLRSEKRPVLVDMTAAWCLTCLVNEHMTLKNPTIQKLLTDHHAVILQGDWTRKDEKITNYLHQFNRDGVPLYVFYPAGGDGRILPQILTHHIIREQFEK